MEDDFVDSGPFCRHWGDPADCDVGCANCGHLCGKHEQMENGECWDDDCTCQAWVEPEETPKEPAAWGASIVAHPDHIAEQRRQNQEARDMADGAMDPKEPA